MNLPRGKIIDTLIGGPDVLRRLLAGLSGRDFNGYIKVDCLRENTEAHGVIILIGSRPVMAIYVWKERIFGQASLRQILRDSMESSCSLKVFTLPDEARGEMDLSIQRFSSARIEMDRFDLEKETRSLREEQRASPAAGSRAPAPSSGFASLDAHLQPKPAAPPGPMADEEADALYLTISQMGVDTTDLKRKEEELIRKEELLRTELEQKLKERDRLRTEEDNFLKMDEELTKLVRQREGERIEKEGHLARKIAELRMNIDKREEDITVREEELKKEIDKLTREKEEMRLREEKLLDMEKMFRRVLTNTEERLKRKEEELTKKEAELERVVRLRMQEIDELRAQALAGKGKAGEATAEFQKVEEALRLKEGALRKREEELEQKVRRFQLELAELEKKRAAAASAAPGAPLPDEEMRKLFRALDALFDRLPQEAVSRFANSDLFQLYEEMMVKLGLAKK